MHKILLALMVAVLLGHANDSTSTYDSLVTELEKLDTYGMSMIEEEPIQVAQNACYGYATCWNSWGQAYEVYCTAYGSGCSWFAQNGRGVQCTGRDSWGGWTSWWVRC
jgi:hypothetical protein